MAMFGKRDPKDQAPEAPSRAIDPATEGRSAPLAIPPLLTEGTAGDGPETDEVLLAETVGSMGVAPDPSAPEDPVLPEVPGESEAATVVTPADQVAAAASGVAGKDRVVDAAQAARDRAAEGVGIARERAAEHTAAAREKLSESAGEAREKLAEGAAEAKARGAKMGKRFAEGMSDARDKVSSAAADARDRAADVDMNEFAHSTTRLIDQARPFFLAGFAVVFAVLGFLEGDSSTAQLFVVGAVLFVIGAAFSSEINVFISHRLHHHQPPVDPPDDTDS